MSKTIKQLFLIDGVGAIISTAMHGLVLARLEHVFGMPRNVLVILATVVFVFAIYSLSCWLFLKDNWSPFLKIIASLNLAFCVATIMLIFLYSEDLTTLGLLYFIIEIIIVVLLALWELKKSVKIDQE